MTTNPSGNIDEWMTFWDSRKVFEARGLPGDGTDPGPRPNNWYVVSMFPYPSGDLHMGHAEVYPISDAMARYAQLKGRNVLNAIGWDSFGLPAENAALKRDLSPKDWTYANIDVQAEGFRRLGMSFDWRTRLHTSDPEYYRWNQWLFLRLYEHGLVYRAKAAVNWCPKDQTVLANEQVVDGACERCHTMVERRELTQWFFKITDYAQRLLDDMDQLDEWPTDVLVMQRNWIGRSSGVQADFAVDGLDETIRIFTSRPDTLFGATFVVVAADAPLASTLVTDEHRQELAEYAATTRSVAEMDRLAASRAKTGLFLGRYAVNPVNGERLPIYASDYVLADYGTGAIMAVPAHDQRDLDFARVMGLPVRVVIDTGQEDPAVSGIATIGPGRVINSGFLDGMSVEEAKRAITADLEARGHGEAAVTYRLRDWLISRQRYWGTPIPVIHCGSCGLVPVPDGDLPVTLPESGYSLRPGAGVAPLATAADWVSVTCPSCGGPAQRDVDTMDTFVDSSWYFLRFPNPSYSAGPFDPEGIRRWLPVDDYIGGKEHAILHLLYARFVTKFLHDIGMVPFTEPFVRLTNQGQVVMNGKSMSKSLGNLVNLQEQLAQFGPDGVRVTMLFASPPEDDIDWADVSAAGSVKWLNRVGRLCGDVGAADTDLPMDDPEVRRGVHRLVYEADQLMGKHRFNVAISRMMELTTLLRKAVDASDGVAGAAVREGAESLAIMLSVVAPFTAEDCWRRLGNAPSVIEAGWPRVDPGLLIESVATCVVQISGKVRARLQVPAQISAGDLENLAVRHQRVASELKGKIPSRVIVKPPRLVNIVP